MLGSLSVRMLRDQTSSCQADGSRTNVCRQCTPLWFWCIKFALPLLGPRMILCAWAGDLTNLGLHPAPGFAKDCHVGNRATATSRPLAWGANFHRHISKMIAAAIMFPKKGPGVQNGRVVHVVQPHQRLRVSKWGWASKYRWKTYHHKPKIPVAGSPRRRSRLLDHAWQSQIRYVSFSACCTTWYCRLPPSS